MNSNTVVNTVNSNTNYKYNTRIAAAMSIKTTILTINIGEMTRLLLISS